MSTLTRAVAYLRGRGKRVMVREMRNYYKGCMEPKPEQLAKFEKPKPKWNIPEAGSVQPREEYTLARTKSTLWERSIRGGGKEEEIGREEAKSEFEGFGESVGIRGIRRAAISPPAGLHHGTFRAQPVVVTAGTLMDFCCHKL